MTSVQAICNGCETSFIRTEARARRYESHCLPCVRIRQKKWRAARKAQGLPASGRSMPPEYQREYWANRTPEDRQRWNTAHAEALRLPENRLKQSAREKTRRAIKTGRLQRLPCKVCGATAEAHHSDYSKPLEVVWLCHAHHMAEHARHYKEARHG